MNQIDAAFCRYTLMVFGLCLSFFLPQKAFGTDRTISVISPEARVTSLVPVNTQSLDNQVITNFDSKMMPTQNGALPLQFQHALMIEEPPLRTLQSRPNPQFGSTHSGLSSIQLRGMPRHEIDSNQLKVMELLAKAGVGIARDFYSYDALRFIVQSRPEAYDFSWFDFTVQNAQRLGIEVIGRITLHSDPWAAGMPQDWKSYAAYVKTVLTRYAGKIRYWQPIKEPEPGPRNRPVDDAGLMPSDVVDVFKGFKQIAAKCDPHARLYFPGTGPPFQFAQYNVDQYLNKIFSLGGTNNIDILGVDAYIKDAKEVIQNRRSLLKQYHSPNIPIWVAQIGAPSAPPIHNFRFQGGGSEQAQCDFVVRAFAESFHAGAQKVFWGEFLDKSKLGQQRNGQNPFDSTGLIEVGTWRLKPAYFTYRLLAAALYGFKDVHKDAGGVYTFTFDDCGPVHLVLLGEQ